MESRDGVREDEDHRERREEENDICGFESFVGKDCGVREDVKRKEAFRKEREEEKMEEEKGRD